MSTQRYISTSFWTDKWIRNLDPSERYLYLYLLTNPQTNIAGVYQITIDRIAFDTGYDERTLWPMLDRFAKSGKAHFFDDEWVIIPSWPKHQRIGERDKNRVGIDRILRDLPQAVYEKLYGVGYEYKYLSNVDRPQDAPSMPHQWSTNYSDTDSDTDTDTDLTSGVPIDTPREPKPLSAMRDELANAYQDAFTAVMPSSTWADVAKERKQLTNIAKKTRALLSDVPYSNEQDLATALLNEYWDAKRTETHDYWTGAPFSPSAFATRWDKIVARLAKSWEDKRRMEEAFR